MNISSSIYPMSILCFMHVKLNVFSTVFSFTLVGEVMAFS